MQKISCTDNISNEVCESARAKREVWGGKRYWELKVEAEDRKSWKDSLSIEHKEEIQIIFYKSMYLLISRVL